jgi:hypothetical protein
VADANGSEPAAAPAAATGMTCVNISLDGPAKSKPSYVMLYDSAGTYTAASEVKEKKVTDSNGHEYRAVAKWIGNSKYLPIRLRCRKRGRPFAPTPPTGLLTITIVNAGPSSGAIPVTYADDNDPADDP